MSWIKCKDKLPDEDLCIFAKYKNNRPIEMFGYDLLNEYALCDENDEDNYLWYAKNTL